MKILCFLGFHKWKDTIVPTGMPDITIGEYTNSFFMEGYQCQICGKRLRVYRVFGEEIWEEIKQPPQPDKERV